MVGSATVQADYYRTLGLTPEATQHEVDQAFAREIRIFRQRPSDTVARLAQLSVAYETLRDPERRRAYDAAMGVRPAPRPAPPFIGGPPPGTVTARIRNGVAPAAPPPKAAAAPPEPRVAAFIATSLRDSPAAKEAEAAAPPPARAQPQPQPQPQPQRRVAATRAERNERAIDARQASLGACLLGLGILALAVSLPQDNAGSAAVTAQPPTQAVTVNLPPITAQSPTAAPVATSLPPVADAAPEQPQPPAEVAAAEEPSPPPAPPAAAQPAETASAQPGETPANEAPAAEASSQAAAEPAPAPAATAARLPLPNATVARTIGRIGYPCGSVASVAAVDGAAGVFKVTCASGHSYQARPVNGRYRFRRWGSL